MSENVEEKTWYAKERAEISFFSALSSFRVCFTCKMRLFQDYLLGKAFLKYLTCSMINEFEFDLTVIIILNFLLSTSQYTRN